MASASVSANADTAARIATVEASVKFHRSILEGGLDEHGGHREGLVQAVVRVVNKLDEMCGDIYGDGDEDRGIKGDMGALKRERKQILWWARTVGGIAVSQLIAIAWYVFTNSGPG